MINFLATTYAIFLLLLIFTKLIKCGIISTIKILTSGIV